MHHNHAQFLDPFLKFAFLPDLENQFLFHRVTSTFIFQFACELGLEDCIETSKSIFIGWIDEGDKNV